MVEPSAENFEIKASVVATLVLGMVILEETSHAKGSGVGY